GRRPIVAHPRDRRFFGLRRGSRARRRNGVRYNCAGARALDRPTGCFVPGIGDAVTTAISLYIVHEARQLGAPLHVIARMLANVALDCVVGAVPVFGDAFDVMWRANRRNVRLLREWLGREKPFWTR